jgi:hypothetical protein
VTVIVALALLFSSIAFSQQLTGTLSGTAYDEAGAVVPNASITLTNQSSGDIRKVTSNGEGYFSFSAVPPGSYSLTVSASGFTEWELKGIVINQGDNRTVPNIALKVGAITEKVEIQSTAESVAPVDTGEVSQTLNSAMVDNIAYVGRNAGELMRIFPGAASNGGLNQNGFNDHTVGSNTGPAGSFSFNGTQPYGSIGYMLDGANLVDPGNAGTQIANVNPDMTAQIKMLTNSYDAEYAIGPVLFQAYGKSGGRDFHGEVYNYSRNGVFDSLQSASKAQDSSLTRANAPAEHYYYTGGNIGGPVLIPWTHFNHDRNKLFFWFGYEYMNQLPVGSVDNYVVPTADMLNGNFSPSVLAPLNQKGDSSYSPSFVQPCAQTGTATTNGVTTPTYNGNGCGGAGGWASAGVVNGVVPASLIDPQGLALLKLLPKPNVNPANDSGFNYQFINPGGAGAFLVPTNRWEQTEKVDYSANDNNKLTVSFVYQKETDLHPIATWWAPASAVPYPSPMPALTPSMVVMGNYTHVFGPSLVNETVVTYARYVNDLSLADPSAVDPSKLGLNTTGLFGKTEKQIPTTLSWSTGLAEFMPQADFYAGGNNIFGATKSDPAVYDNLSWTKGSHTMKFGFFWDTNSNVQNIGPLGNGGIQGNYEFEQYSPRSTDNLIADELMGIVNSYSQANAGPFATEQFHQISGYAQDSWKIGKRFTLNYGLRIDHIGQYYDPNSPGYWVWDPAVYSNAANAPANTGLVNHSTDKNVPRSGMVSPFAYYLPRFSAAYDVFGNGKTVVRGGFAEFKYQMGINTPSGADDTGAFSYSSGAFVGVGTGLGSLTAPAGTSYNGGSFTAMIMGLGKVPSTRDYNFTVDQAIPGHSLLEVAYVGTYNYNGILYGGAGNGLENANAIPQGAFFNPDPVTGAPGCVQGVACPTGFNSSDYYPLRNYQSISLVNYGSYSNYNGLQATWQKQSGPVLFFTNYTFSKVLGIRDGYSGDGGGAGNIVDQLNYKANYGVLAYDHSHILNFSYVWTLPSPMHSNIFAKGLVNGWTLSGITTMQAGPPIQPNTNGTLNSQFAGEISTSTWLGTNMANLAPSLTCDPRSNLQPHQYFNPNCFTTPAVGTYGDIIWPYIKGPWNFDSDLSLYKSFKWGESKSIQFRVDAFNFLNHPNGEFNETGGNNDVELQFHTANGTPTTTNQNALTTGYPEYTIGFRTIEFAAKFYF